MISVKINHLVCTRIGPFPRDLYPKKSLGFSLSADEFNAHMGRYGYTDILAEGAVGGSTDFVSFVPLHYHSVTDQPKQGNVTYGGQQP
jgi:hypothetical protein